MPQVADFLALRSAGLHFLLPVALVKSVRPLPGLAPVPLAPPWLLGIGHDEEGPFPVTDAALKLKLLQNHPLNPDGCLVCVRDILSPQPLNPTPERMPTSGLYFDAMIGLVQMTPTGQAPVARKLPALVRQVWRDQQKNWIELNTQALFHPQATGTATR